MIALTIDDVAEIPRRNSVSIIKNADGRDVASFKADDLWAVGQRVGFFNHSGVRAFGGTIDEVRHAPPGEFPAVHGITYEYDCTSWEHRLDKRIVGKQNYGQVFTADASTDTLTSNYHHLVDDQIIRVKNLGGALPTGLNELIDYYIINRTDTTFQVSTSQGGAAVNFTDDGNGTHRFMWRAGDIATHLVNNWAASELADPNTYVEAGAFVDAAIYRFDQTVWAALVELANVSGYTVYVDEDLALHFEPRTATAAPFDITDVSNIRKFRLRKTREDYRNRQHIRADWSAVEPAVESNPGDDATQQFWLDDRPEEIVSVTIDGTEQTFGVDGVDSNRQFYWAPGEMTFRQDASEAPVATGQTLFVTYRVLGADVITVDDTTEQTDRATIEGGSGIYGNSKAATHLVSADAAEDAGDAELEAYASIMQVATYESEADGLKPGQLQTITLTEHSVDTTFLIRRVTMTDVGLEVFRSQVLAVDGVRRFGYLDYFRSLAGGGTGTAGLLTGGGGVSSDGVISYSA